MLERIRQMAPLNNELVVAAERLLGTLDEDEAIRLITARQNNPRDWTPGGYSANRAKGSFAASALDIEDVDAVGGGSGCQCWDSGVYSGSRLILPSIGWHVGFATEVELSTKVTVTFATL
jgi:hypothetical protein